MKSKKEYGTYYRTLGAYHKRGDPNTHYTLHIPFPEDRICFKNNRPVINFAKLQNAYMNMLDLDFSLPTVLAGDSYFHVEQFKSYLKEHWDLDRPANLKMPRIPNAHCASNLYHALKLLADTCQHGYQSAVVQYCFDEFEEWWHPGLHMDIIGRYLPVTCQKHEHIWGAYYTAWRLQKPDALEFDYKTPNNMLALYSVGVYKRKH